MLEDTGFKIKEQDAGIIECNFTRPSPTNEDSTAVAKGVVETVNTVLKNYGEAEALMLLELNSEEGPVSTEALLLYSKILRHPHIMRLAIFGGTKKYRELARAILPFTPHRTLAVFETKRDAMHWLVNS